LGIIIIIIIIIIVVVVVAKPEAHPDKPKCDAVTVTSALFVLRGHCQFIFRLNGQNVHWFVLLRNFEDFAESLCPL